MKNRGQTASGLGLIAVTLASFVLLFLSLQANAQTWPSTTYGDVYNQTPLTPQCSNGSFESGFTDWTGFRAKRQVGLAYENNLIAAPGPLLSNSCASAPGIGNTGSGNTCHMIEASGSDPNLPSVSHPMTVAGGSSLRLGGNAFSSGKSNGWAIEGVAKRFIVQSSDAIYRFRYSSVMDKAHDSTTAFTGEEPYFQAIAIDPVTGAVIDQIDQPASGFNPWMVVNPDNPSMVYSIWTCAQLDLSSHVGKEVIVYFVNSDCAHGAHTAYTYVDDVCTTCEDGDITIDPDVDTELKICEPGKTAEVKGSFSIPPALNTSNVTISLEVKQAGTTINTLTTGTITGTNYSFTLSQTDLKGIGCYDFVAVLEYDVTTPSGNVVHVKKETSPEGFKAGVDNDVCVVDCPPPPAKDTCLGSDTKVACGEDGSYIITLEPKGVDGVVPDTVAIASLTPGVTIVPAKPSYPVVGGQVVISVVGANPGDVIDLQVDGTTFGGGSVEGSDLCCSGKVAITIPADLICALDDPKLTVEKICDCPPQGPVQGISCQCKITVASSGPVTGQLAISELLTSTASTGTISSISSTEPWLCSPVPPASAGTPVDCGMSGADLNAAGGTSVIDVTIKFDKIEDAKGAKNCVRLEHDSPLSQTEDCADLEPASLVVEKTCDPAVAVPGMLAVEADCKITVTATGTPIPQTIEIVEKLEGPVSTPPSASQIISMTSAESWVCPVMPVDINVDAACQLPGADLVSAGGQSLINVKVRLWDDGVARESQNCVGATGLDSAGAPVLGAPRVCVKLTADKPVVALTCDPKTAQAVGDSCRCTIQGMVPVSKTACDCPDGTDLLNGVCAKPVLQCEAATSVLKGDACACKFAHMAQTSPTECACVQGYTFKAGVGCVKPETKCEEGTRFNPTRNRCEPVCRKGFQYDRKRNACVQIKEPPVCDPRTTIPRGDACACRYPNMDLKGQSCSCEPGFKLQPGVGCVKPQVQCDEGTRFNVRRNRCEPVCRKGTEYDRRRNACVETEKKDPVRKSDDGIKLPLPDLKGLLKPRS